MSDNLGQSFVAQLVGDVIAADTRLASDNIATNRRDVVRTRYAAIEGLVWIMREHVHTTMRELAYLTPLADLALRERSYVVTDSGDVKEQVRFTPLRQAIRLIVGQARLLSPDLDVTFTEPGWQALKDAALIRNRVTHPRSVGDMTISADDLARLGAGMAWLLATTEYVMSRTSLSFKWFNEEARVLLISLQRGDPDALAAYHAFLVSDENP